MSDSVVTGVALTLKRDLEPAVRSLYKMLLIREFEQQVLDLYSRGQISGIVHLSVGQEAVAVGVCDCLTPADTITSTHRGHGHCLAKGAELGGMFAELLGKADGYCRGKGGSMHIANQMQGNLGANAIVGGGVGIATGSALSAKLTGSGHVSVCFFGDGALNQGVLYEAFNIAVLWKLPVIYVCENNQYGEYTPMQAVTAGDVRKRAEAFDVATECVDGMDLAAVRAATMRLVERARSGLGPGFLLCDTYRYYGHGMSDRNRAYRTREEEQQWRSQRDPIDSYSKKLIDEGVLSEGQLFELRADVDREIQDALSFASQSPFPDPEEVWRDVYAD